jgi:hypothetical protein
MSHDKKVVAGSLRLVLLKGLAQAVTMPMRRAPRSSRPSKPAAMPDLAPTRSATATAAAAPLRAATQGAQRVSARPRPHRAFHGVSPPRVQDPGFRQPRRRPVPHPPDAQHRGGADRPLDARALRLNDDLAEAIALAHDLGHTPFGHAGQDALNECMQGHGGFEHNLQSLRIVDRLEERYGAFDGLNLMFETREGILKHCSPARARELGELGRRFLEGRQPSLEAQICNLADEIAYNNHDVDDGLRSGLLTLEQLQNR